MNVRRTVTRWDGDSAWKKRDKVYIALRWSRRGPGGVAGGANEIYGQRASRAGPLGSALQLVARIQAGPTVVASGWPPTVPSVANSRSDGRSSQQQR